MKLHRRRLLQGGLFVLTDLLIGKTAEAERNPTGLHYTSSGTFYPNDRLKWLYIGWENDHPKSWTFMGGAVSPGQRATIQYAVSINGILYVPDELGPDRMQKIRWYLREGFLPVPVSEWAAGPILVTIQHFSDRILHDTATAVYTRVLLRNRSQQNVEAVLHVSASGDFAVSLSGHASTSGEDRTAYECKLGPDETAERDFVALANGEASARQLAVAGNYDAHYASMKSYWLSRIEPLAHPVALPSPGLADMYKALQIVVWENMVKVGGDYEIHAAPRTPANLYDYDRTFSHDAPNYVDQMMREGDCETAKKMLESGYYKDFNRPLFPDQNYLDAIGKYMLPFAEYLRVTGDLAYFTQDRRLDLKKASRNIHSARTFADPAHPGLMSKSQDFENWAEGGDYLLCDNWSALHGLQAYKYICDALGETEESNWAVKEMADLNGCLNHAIEKSCAEGKTAYYLGAFDKATHLRYQEIDYSWVPYSGALSTFPWGAYLKGFELGGAWKDRFDASLEYALRQRDEKGVPQGSWGTWWGHLAFGSTYNASAGVQCLFSEKYRTEAIRNVEFMAQYQCAPYQWSEAYEFKGADQWVGMYTPPVSYGNQDSWGYSFVKQALLQACISVKTDGTVILGRGIPDQWMLPGSIIEWANVNVNNRKTIGFRITAQERSLELTISGDIPHGDLLLNLPILKNNVLSVSTGLLDVERGLVTLPRHTRFVTVQLKAALPAATQ